ncbi:fimbrial protein [Aeromonas veronii]|uniref:fimbrial protein n=1 Tax=Aeromonas veronii TaxID=654 RepID=UPI002B4A3523|nr:fimbrial protein [Aeromonas veronii]
MKLLFKIPFFISTILFPTITLAYPCYPKSEKKQIEADAISIDAPSDGSSPLNNVTRWDVTEKSQIYCQGATPNVSENLDVQFNFKLSPGDVIRKNERDFLIINDYFALAFEVMVGGKVNEYKKVSSQSIWYSNQDVKSKKFDENAQFTSSTIDSGTKGRVYLLILKPFIGAQVIPRRKVIQIKAALGLPEESAQEFADVFVEGTITSNASCDCTENNYTINFGEMSAGDIVTLDEIESSQVHKYITLSANCSPSLASSAMVISMISDVSDSDNRLFKTNNAGVGIAVKSNEKLVYPRPSITHTPSKEQIADLDNQGNIKQALFKVVPIRYIKNDKVDGAFTATATLQIDFK